MFAAAIGHLRAQLNEHLTRFDGSTEDVVILSNVQQTDGSVEPEVENKLAMFVTNFQRDALPVGKRNAQTSMARLTEKRPPVHFNIYMMIAACHSGKRYAQGLKLLSAAVAFFQSTPVFDHHTSPGLDPGIDRLILDIENLDTQSLGTLWGVLGGTYLPSVLYRLRLVTVDAGAVVAEVPVIRSSKTAAEG